MSFKSLNSNNIFALLSIMAIILVPDYVFANSISDALCKVVNELTGGVGKGVAAVAVIFLGFSLFLGKVNWGTAIALAIGIAAIFGAESIVNLVSSGDETVKVCA